MSAMYRQMCTQADYKGMEEAEFKSAWDALKSTCADQAESLIGGKSAIAVADDSVVQSDAVMFASASTNTLRQVAIQEMETKNDADSSSSSGISREDYWAAMGDMFRKDALAWHRAMKSAARANPNDAVIILATISVVVVVIVIIIVIVVT